MAGKAEKPGNRGKTEKAGAHRAAFKADAALEALIWAKGGEQLALPGVGARRFIGVEPAPDDKSEGKAGRPPGAQNAVPEAFRRYLLARYGSAIEGLAQEATRPLASIVAELVDAAQVVAQSLGRELFISSEDLIDLAKLAANLRTQARRYVAPFQHTQAPQPMPAQAPSVRIGVSIHTNGQPGASVLVEAQHDLAGILGIEQNQEVIEHEPQELDAGQLDASATDGR